MYHTVVTFKKDKWDTVNLYDDNGNYVETMYSQTLSLNKFIHGEVKSIYGIFFADEYGVNEFEDHITSTESIGGTVQLHSDKLPDVDIEFLIYFTIK